MGIHRRHDGRVLPAADAPYPPVVHLFCISGQGKGRGDIHLSACTAAGARVRVSCAKGVVLISRRSSQSLPVTTRSRDSSSDRSVDPWSDLKEEGPAAVATVGACTGRCPAPAPTRSSWTRHSSAIPLRYVCCSCCAFDG